MKEKVYLYLLGGTTVHIRTVFADEEDTEEDDYFQDEEDKPIWKKDSQWLSSFCVAACSQNHAPERFRASNHGLQPSQTWPGLVGVKEEDPQPPSGTVDNVHHFCNRVESTEEGRRVRTDRLTRDQEEDLGRLSVVDLSWLQVCRQAYAEANPVLWTSNIFSFVTPASLYHFKKVTTSTQRKLMRCVRIEAHRDVLRSPEGWRKVVNKGKVRCLSGVQQLHLEISEAYMIRRRGFPHDRDDNAWRPARRAAFVGILFEPLQMLPLERATVSVFTDPEVPEWDQMRWKHDHRLAWGERTQKRLEDPDGARKYKELHGTVDQWNQIYARAPTKESLSLIRCPFRHQEPCDLWYDGKDVEYDEVFERVGDAGGEVYCLLLHEKSDGSWARREKVLTDSNGGF